VTVPLHCPRCRIEYRDGFSVCADCGSALAGGAPPPEVPVQHDLELVTALEARDSFGVSLAKAALEEAGIPYVLVEQPSGLPPGMWGEAGIGLTPLWKCHSVIRVPREFAGQARELLEPLQNPED
jgi:hypothetical protein